MSKGKKHGSIRGLELMVLYVFLMLFLVVADQISKRAIVFSMKLDAEIPVIDNFFSLHYVINKGSAFSFLADKEWGISALTAISAVMGALVVVLMGVACKKHLKLLGFAFCLIASGAFGNLIDRVYHKYVIDFLRFDFGNYTFPIFNFADICAVVGTVILMGIIIFGAKYFDAFWGPSNKKKKEKAEKAVESETSVKEEEKESAGSFDEEPEKPEEPEAEPEDEPKRAPVRSAPLSLITGDLTEQDDED
ncbi:MAG: signal peptidase II [Clostridiales bacterium]|nr:signal peptidase II [Clostridiales bacterium]MBR6488388.1 signal peptidase II [Clostridiales bacterium]